MLGCVAPCGGFALQGHCGWLRVAQAGVDNKLGHGGERWSPCLSALNTLALCLGRWLGGFLGSGVGWGGLRKDGFLFDIGFLLGGGFHHQGKCSLRGDPQFRADFHDARHLARTQA